MADMVGTFPLEDVVEDESESVVVVVVTLEPVSDSSPLSLIRWTSRANFDRKRDKSSRVLLSTLVSSSDVVESVEYSVE